VVTRRAPLASTCAPLASTCAPRATIAALLALAGCPTGEHGVKHDAAPLGSSGAASGGPSAAAGHAHGATAPAAPAGPRHPGAKTGDVSVRVEWVDVPVAARTNAGATACKTPRAPAVEPTATWGIPDAVVLVDGAPAAHAEPARITVSTCAGAPRLVAAPALEVTSADEHPDALVLHARGSLDHLADIQDGATRALQLPYAGHTVAAALDRGAIYSLEAPPDTLAWIVASPSAALTEANGQVIVHDVPVGAHAVTAWLPPREGQPARTGKATVTVVGGELVEVTVPLAP
jgi:hypothetical protein